MLSDKNPPFEIKSSPGKAQLPLICHIPHSSTIVPSHVRGTLLISNSDLDKEILAMTDHFTDELFDEVKELGGLMFVNRVSRLVFDPERFLNDSDEPMSAYGMGAVYLKTKDELFLRDVNEYTKEREKIIEEFFNPYLIKIETEIEGLLRKFGKCFIVDGHSFPLIPSPYENANLIRPDICLGYDSYHGPKEILDGLTDIIKGQGFSVSHNTPFSGSYVPGKFYRKNHKVKSLMIEINRGTYMDERMGTKGLRFEKMKRVVSKILNEITQYL